MIDKIKSLIEDSIKAKKGLLDNLEILEASSKLLIDCLKNNNKILICGNGGSASQAQHFAGELVGRFEAERRGLPCISLTTDTSIITSISNDYCFDNIFERQVESLGNTGDVLIGISTSGNSKNIIRAVDLARKKGLKVISLLGKSGGQLKQKGDINIIVPVENTARIQESHILILHIWAKLVEDYFKSSSSLT